MEGGEIMMGASMMFRLNLREMGHFLGSRITSTTSGINVEFARNWICGCLG